MIYKMLGILTMMTFAVAAQDSIDNQVVQRKLKTATAPGHISVDCDGYNQCRDGAGRKGRSLLCDGSK